MKVSNTNKLTGLAVAVIFTSTSWAEKMADFDTLDQNQDGKLTANEVVQSSALTTRWTQVDQDGNASIDRQEFSAFEEAQQQPRSDAAEMMTQQPSSEHDAAAKSQGMERQGSQSGHPLYSMSPDELQGKDVMGADGQKLGTVSKVISDRNSGRIHVVVSGGGFMGLASREHAFPLDDVQMQAGNLSVPATKQDLEGHSEYSEDNYVDVEPENRPISEFSAFEEESESAEKSMSKESDKERPSRYED